MGLLTEPLCLLSGFLQHNLLPMQLALLLPQHVHFLVPLSPLAQEPAVEDAEPQPKMVMSSQPLLASPPQPTIIPAEFLVPREPKTGAHNSRTSIT